MSGQQRPSMPDRLWAPHRLTPGEVLVFAAGAYTLAFVAWQFLSPGGMASIPSAGSLAHVPVGLSAALLAWGASTRLGETPRAQIAWRLIGLAGICYAIGDATWFLSDAILHSEPVTAAATIAYVLFYPAMLAGLLGFAPSLSSRTDRVEFVLDAAMAIVGGAMLCWYLVLGPAALSGAGGALGVAISVGSPIGDLILLFGVVAVSVRRADVGSPRALRVLTTGLLFLMAADLVFGSESLQGAMNSVPDSLYTVAWFLLAAAGQLQSRDAGVPASPPSAANAPAFALSPVPYVAVLFGYGILLFVGLDIGGTLFGGLVIGGAVLTVLVVVRQIVALRDNAHLQAARATQVTEARFRSLVQNASDMVTVVDVDTRVRYQTPSVERILGYGAEQLIGEQLTDLAHPDDVSRLLSIVADAAGHQGLTGAEEWRLRHADGSWLYVEGIAANLLEDPNVNGLVLTLRDIRERKALEEQLTHQAFHDPLTGLANRALFVDRVEHALARAKRRHRSLSVLFMDMDNFKTINDSMGHAAGDGLLVEVAARIRSCLRVADTPARLGGDEFAVLLEDSPTREDAVRAAERITEAIGSPWLLNGMEVFPSVSVGIAFSPAGRDTASELLRNADVAMYTAKGNGKARYELYEPSMHTAVLHRLELEASLRRALGRGEFEVYYQPIVELASRHIGGLEALLRWNHPERGLVLPAEIIPIAEETGLIVPIGRWVLMEACRQGQTWQTRYPMEPPLSVSVNLSLRQLQDPALVGDVCTALDMSGLPPSALRLEMTESALMFDTEATMARLKELKTLGVQLAIDDFGTGYSSLSYLHNFPVDIVKIDKTFVDGLADQGTEQSPLVRGIIELGRAMHLETIAEGIELDEQSRRLEELGCRLGQGFLFAHPLDVGRMESLLRERHSSAA